MMSWVTKDPRYGFKRLNKNLIYPKILNGKYFSLSLSNYI